MQTDDRLLYDTGRLPIWLRLPASFAGLFALWLSASIVSSYLFGNDLGVHAKSGSPWLGFLASLVLGLFFVSLWFLRNRIFINSSKDVLRVDHSGLFGLSKRTIPLEGAEAVYLHCGRVKASTFWDMGIEFRDGRREWLTREYNNTKADQIAKIFSEASGLPVVNE